MNWFVLSLLGVMIAGIYIELPGPVVSSLQVVSHYAIVALFFVYGARLRTDEVIGGVKNYRLQLIILIATFLAYPLLGAANDFLVGSLLGSGFALGMYYTTLLPSTVQSSISFTSIAKGNVAGALTAATISNLLGTVVTPLLVIMVFGQHDTVSLATLIDIAWLILLPFLIGQLCGRWIRSWLQAHPWLTRLVDKGTIILVVTAAVSAAKRQGLWDTVSPLDFGIIGIDATVLVVIMLLATWFGAKLLGLDRADRIAAMMCGSKKSLATGLPMAMIIFPASQLGHIAVPIMVLHLLQLLICSLLASALSKH